MLYEYQFVTNGMGTVWKVAFGSQITTPAFAGT
jgi:hypothetical protein